jgi:peptidoglycan/LPS O-acetylase OafA/YrhL
MRSPTNLGRFSAGDALRGISALGVLLLHVTIDSLTSTNTLSGDLNAALRGMFGPLGVVAIVGGLCLGIFFVLSGYLISRPFVRAYVRDERRPDIGRYGRNRLLRIVPAFWAAVLATLLVFGLLGSPPWVLPVTLLFGQGLVPEQPFVLQIAQGWTLGTEMVFYALVPVVAVWWGRTRNGTRTGRGARVLLVALAMLALSIAWHILAPTDESEWFYVFPSVAGAFAPGVALAAVETAWPELLTSPRVRRLAAPVALLGIALLVLLAATTLPPVGEVRLVLWWTGAGLIVGGALMREWSGAPAWRLLKNPATDWAGQRSYSIYVLHYGVAIWIVERVRVLGHPRETYAILLPLTLVATLALATASWHLVEQPFLRLRKRRTKT